MDRDYIQEFHKMEILFPFYGKPGQSPVDLRRRGSCFSSTIPEGDTNQLHLGLLIYHLHAVIVGAMTGRIGHQRSIRGAEPSDSNARYRVQTWAGIQNSSRNAVSPSE
ncbi:MAG: hypothetical protein ACREUL_01985 [Steroidobacteraceae bacterium]